VALAARDAEIRTEIAGAGVGKSYEIRLCVGAQLRYLLILLRRTSQARLVQCPQECLRN
jgi:hypothetical protein